MTWSEASTTAYFLFPLLSSCVAEQQGGGEKAHAVEEAVAHGSAERLLLAEAYGSDDVWCMRAPGKSSCVLRFYEADNGYLNIEIEPEFHVRMPIVFAGDQLNVFFDPDLDSKYSYSLAEAMQRTDSSWTRGVFMTLRPEGDSILLAEYPQKGLMAHLAQSGGDSLIFPHRFKRQTKE